MSKLACIQYGNYLEAVKNFQLGKEETYGHQRYSVEAFQNFVKDSPHLVISLDKPDAKETIGSGTYMTLSEPSWLPQRIRDSLLIWRIHSHLEKFKPSQILLRVSGRIGLAILKWADARKVPVAVLIAARFNSNSKIDRDFCKWANRPNVLFVANHNKIATQTLIECGLESSKAVAWDYPQIFSGKPPKDAPAEWSILYAGTVSESKGVPDLVKGLELTQPVKLTICGEGDFESPNYPWIEKTGKISSKEIMKRMDKAALVVVPTRPEYSEALPLVITEALSTRTPLILSDHPVFLSYFKDREGVLFFKSGNPESLSHTINMLKNDPELYKKLSLDTEKVWKSLQIETKFHHILEKLI